MDFSKLGIISLLGQKMSYIEQRHNVLAENIANADTPHYKSKDLKKVNFGETLKETSGRLQMAATDPKHFQLGGAASFGTETKKGWDQSPDENDVVPEEEAMKMSENSADFQAATSMYAKIADLFRTVVSDK